MPAASTRTTWKGAISFGLVHIPIELRSGTLETRQNFKWIDPATNSAVGNKQVSKATGKDVASADIVKGIEVGDGEYVTLTREEIREALPKTTQTIEIESFVDSGSIPAAYFSKPYHVSPSGKGQKPYALLRDTLHKTGKVGLAKVVISTKQHFAALMPQGRGLVLNLLRWSEEVRTMEGLALPSEDVKVSPRELEMAEMLVNDLAGEWSPDLFHDEFKEQLAELIDKKAKSGKSIMLAGSPESATPRVEGGEVVDLTEILKRSLQNRRPAPIKPDAAANDAKVTPLRSAAAKKAPTKAATTANTASKRNTGGRA